MKPLQFPSRTIALIASGEFGTNYRRKRFDGKFRQSDMLVSKSVYLRYARALRVLQCGTSVPVLLAFNERWVEERSPNGNS